MVSCLGPGPDVELPYAWYQDKPKVRRIQPPQMSQTAGDFILDTDEIHQYSFHKEIVMITWIGRNILILYS
jgi:hypothetical protein